MMSGRNVDILMSNAARWRSSHTHIYYHIARGLYTQRLPGRHTLKLLYFFNK